MQNYTGSGLSVARLNNNGQNDNTFNIGSSFWATGEVSSILIQSDGKFIFLGSFHNFNSVVRKRIMRITNPILNLNEVFYNSKIPIYPNPTKDFLNIENDKEFDYEIYETSGKFVMSVKKIENKIDVSKFTKGNYIIKIKIDNKIINQKFIKE